MKIMQKICCKKAEGNDVVIVFYGNFTEVLCPFAMNHAGSHETGSSKSKEEPMTTGLDSCLYSGCSTSSGYAWAD